MTILITGASGFLGSLTAEHLAKTQEVLCLSRSKPQTGLPFVQGAFGNPGDLRQLDGISITAVVHLAAVTGGCSEEDGLAVNVQGTRRLLRYLLDRGCRKFVVASSIAAVGCLDSEFLPLAFPIADDHPCLASDAYGLSKSLSEEVSRYLSRNAPDADFIHLRLGAVQPDHWIPRPVGLDTKLILPVTSMSLVLASDVVRAIDAALASSRPGMRVYNVVGPDASCDVPVADKLRAVFGDRMAEYDMGYYESPGNAFKPLFAMEKIKAELGFEPVMTTIPHKRLSGLSGN